MYQKDGMESKEIQRVLRFFLKGAFQKGEKELELLVKKDAEQGLLPRAETLLAANYFAKGQIEKLAQMPLQHQLPQERQAIRSLLPFYSDYTINLEKEQAIKGEEVLPGLIFVPVKVNGTEGLFLFDTGAMVTVVRQGFCPLETLERPDEELKPRNAFGEELTQKQVAVVQRLRLGQVTVGHKRVMVLPEEYLTFPVSPNEKITIDGVIGFDIIKNLPWELDLEQLRVTPLATKGESGEPNLFCDFFPLVKVKGLEGEKEAQLFAFDTGANQTLFIQREQKEGDLTKEEKAQMFAAGGQGQGPLKWERNKTLTLGGKEVFYSQVAVMENMTPISFHFNVRGLIGMDSFKNKKVLVDFPGNRLEIF